MRVFPFSRFRIVEESMKPVLKPGDRVLTFNWGKIKKSDVVVFRHGGSCYVKRVIGFSKSSLIVAGDNKLASMPMGPIDKNSLIGKVIWKYR